MKILIKPNVEKKLLGQQFWNAIALKAIRVIRNRTRQSRDMEGKKFREYNKQYLKKRRDAGILNAATVNLEFSRAGGMLKSLDHMVAQDLESVVVYFNDDRARELAGYHNDTGAGRSRVIRKFFGITPDAAKRILGEIDYTKIDNLFRK